MMVLIEDALTVETLAVVRDALEAAHWREGKATAGAMARPVKDNLQAAPGPEIETLQRVVAEALTRHPVFQRAARPKALSRLMFSRYEPGQAYGAHTDDALMAAADGGRLRTDLAFTLFLEAPEAYSGGELVIDGPAGEQAVKLPAGGLVLYPAGSIHRVAPVSAGARLACVGWAQSLVRDPWARETLFELATLRADLNAPREQLLMLDKAISNLLRMWAEP